MKLKNKKTGEIVDFMIHKFAELSDGGNPIYVPFSGSIEDWEDAPEEPKGYWYIRDGGNIDYNLYGKSIVNRHKAIGNYFETKEEAEKAVEKLKAWKRLRDKGFRFIEGYLDNNDDFIIKAKLGHVGLIDQPDVHLLFGSEE